MKQLFKEKKFLIGFIFLSLLLTLSIGNTVFNKAQISKTDLSFGENGSVLGRPPYAPSFQHVLGTDYNGYDMLHIIIQGAKFTIGIALLITVIRLAVSYLAGMLISTYVPKITPAIRMIAEPFTIIPQVIIAYFLLKNVLTMPADGFQNPFWQRALFEVILLSIIAFPSLTLQISEQMRNHWNKEFIQSAVTLGGSKTHIFIRHVRPLYVEQGVIVFIQQFIQVLTLLAHLGVVELFFGGTFIGPGDPPKTLSYEWSGLIGDSYPFIRSHPWIPLVVIVFFTLTVLAVQMMLSSAEKVSSMKRARH